MKLRMFIAEKNFSRSSKISLESKDFNYIAHVMRKRVGDEIIVFNGCEGDWTARIESMTKKSASIELIEKVKEQSIRRNITLAFAMIKNIEAIAEKGTEMGVGKFVPLITQHSVVAKLNKDRFRANIKEACEQCERNDVPELEEVTSLQNFLQNVESSKSVLIVCDESGRGNKITNLSLPKTKSDSEIIILIGPEGGFSKEEFEKFEKYPRLSLGNTILKADTAAITAIALITNFAINES